MSTLVLLQSVIVLAALMIALLSVAYLSNTGRLPGWTRDVWVVPTVILLGVYLLGVVFEASLPEVTCIVSVATIISIAVVIAARRQP